VEMAASDMAALKGDPLWRKREPHPAAPYSKDIRKAVADAFDRSRPEPTHIPKAWLKSYARSLARYHLHPEAKFLGGNFDERGTLRRRHVHVTAVQQIGKEADNLEEREFIGDSDDDLIQYDFEGRDRSKLRAFILNTAEALNISDRELCDRAKVSHHTMSAVRQDKKVKNMTLIGLVGAVGRLRQERTDAGADQDNGFDALQERRAELGSDAALAEFLGVSRSYTTRLLSGERRLTESLIERLKAK
jgi:AraC-like DNA-binding protein